MQPKAAVQYVDESDVDVSIPIGQKQLSWWSRKYYAADGSLLTCFLRIGHPERMNKEDYVTEVANWITDSLNSFEPNKVINWIS